MEHNNRNELILIQLVYTFEYPFERHKKKKKKEKHLLPKNGPFVFTSYTSRVYWILSPRFYDHVSCNFLTSIETSRELMRQSSSAPFMPATVSTRYSIW